MDDTLILSFLRLVRNGRSHTREDNTFILGDLRMLDEGPYVADREALQTQRLTKGSLSQVALAVCVKGAVAEIWYFRDLRVPNLSSPKLPPPYASSAFQGTSLTFQQENSLKTLVRVVYAYLRIHELFVEIMGMDMHEVATCLVVDMNELPHLEKDLCEKKVWEVEGLLSIKVIYNCLWRTSLGNQTVTFTAVNSTVSTSRRVENIAEQRIGSAPGIGSESIGSGLSLPTPHFAPAPPPSSIGSGMLSISQKCPKSPTIPLPEIFLPHAMTAMADSLVFFKTPVMGAVAAALADRGTCTAAVRCHNFAPVSAFVAAGSNSSEDDKMQSIADELHDLLDACDGATLHEVPVDLNEVLDMLEKKPLDP
ncbi:hypothetical protein DQ04_00361120 [Trypanosoma grayi]|uniref:hypothetical protein n=1 Tax=Trypanosoma grayi TaxID=71804 RepID=UPI0004F4A741|nr:hypothetical protein DQ04_00361120 [Trypanosoma grayi]KEG14650.1 hypothetical protein DQ04_00361120 [Trypanosoma grayi]